MPHFKAVLFDLDGTLLDTAPDFITALNIQLKMHGRAPLTNSEVRTSVTNGSAGLILAGFGMTHEHPEFNAVKEQYLDLYFKHLADKTHLFKGLNQVLETCLDKQIPWGIVTNKPWKYTIAVLERLSLMTNCATVICPDHVVHPKPHPEAMFLAADKLALAPEDCIYIGDHRRDIDAGRAAGMATVAAGWGYIPSSEDISSWNASFVVHKSDQLYQLLFKQ